MCAKNLPVGKNTEITQVTQSNFPLQLIQHIRWLHVLNNNL